MINELSLSLTWTGVPIYPCTQHSAVSETDFLSDDDRMKDGNQAPTVGKVGS